MPEPIVRGMDRVVARVVFGTQQYDTPNHADTPLVLKLGSSPMLSKLFYSISVCIHSVDDQYQPLFDIQFLFYKFTDQHKRKFYCLVPCNLLMHNLLQFEN